MQNHAADPDDEGTVWFDDSGAEDKMLLFLEELTPPPPRATLHKAEKDGDGAGGDLRECEDLRVLDLGTGNGHMLFAMQDGGWAGHMVGVDYSVRSVQLAEQIQQRRRQEADGSEDTSELQFVQWDMLREEPDRVLRLTADEQRAYDIVLDKGTFDAISLSNEAIDVQGRTGCEVYPERVKDLVMAGGYLLITSCNWTEDELRKWFEGGDFAYHDTISYPSFTFGGQKGQTVSSVCFRRRDAIDES